MQMLNPTFAEFQQYLRWPSYQQPLSDSVNKPWQTTARLFLREYPLIISLIVLSVSLVLALEYMTGANSFTSLLHRYTSSMGIVLAAIPIAVIIEEAIFHAILRLTPNRLRNISAFLAGGLVTYGYQITKENNPRASALWFSLAWVLLVGLFSFWLKRPGVFDRIHTFWQTNFRWIYYAISGLYALSKVVNGFSELTGWQLLIVPVMLLTGLLGGSYYGYIRMKYGFWYAVVVHSVTLMAPLMVEVMRTL